MNKSNNVLVVGASGETGNAICSILSEKQVSHLAFVREGSEAKIDSKSTGVVFGDVLKLDTLKTTFEQHDFTDIVIALGSRDLKKNFIRSKGTQVIIEALKQANKKCTLHVVSALGVNESWSQLGIFSKLIAKLLLSSTMKDHELQENCVVASGFDYHIVRPVGLTNAKDTKGVIVKNEGKLPSNTISRIDLATYICKSILENKTGKSSVCSKG